MFSQFTTFGVIYCLKRKYTHIPKNICVKTMLEGFSMSDTSYETQLTEDYWIVKFAFKPVTCLAIILFNSVYKLECCA